MILIDEADNASSELKLGSFLKLLIERLQRHQCQQIMVGLAGLPELRQVLLDSHPSSLRVFEELPLGRLSDDEVKRVIDICIEQANKRNTDKTTIAAETKSALVNLAEGYPHFIQQLLTLLSLQIPIIQSTKGTCREALLARVVL